MARIVILGSYAPSLCNFRGALMKALGARGHKVYGVAPGEEAPGDMQDRMDLVGAEYVPISLARTGTNPWKDWKSYGELTALFRKIAPQVVLSYTMKPVLYGSLAARKAGVGSICSLITGLGYSFSGASFKQRILGKVLRVGLQKALKGNEAVLFQNPDDQQFFIENHLVEAQKTLRVWGSGVDVEHFAQVPLPPPEVPVHFLLVARLLREKGVREYAAAAALVHQSYPEARFSLVGPLDTNPGAVDEQEVVQWHRQGVVNYLGSMEDVRSAIAAASVYVLPSYREGTPRSTLEAMAMGRPVITTDVPGCRETLEEGRNGYLVPPGDPGALAAKMSLFCENPSMISSMGEESRRMAEERFCVHRVNRVMIGVLEEGRSFLEQSRENSFPA